MTKYQEWVENHREHLREYHRDYRKKNKEKIKGIHKRYRIKNRELINKRNRERYKNENNL